MDSGKDSGQKPRRSLHEPVFHTSRIKPLLEVHLEARKHLFFNVFDVGELAPPSDIAVFAGALELHNEFLHQPQLVPVFLPEVLLANVRRLFLPILSS
jgi:hypothetical protein